MTDAVEVAIEGAFLASTAQFASINGLDLAIPNIAFVPPTVSTTAKYLKADFLPVPTTALAVSFADTNQHNGILQISVFYGQGSGEMAPARIAASVIAWFKRGTTVTADGFTATVIRPPYRGPLMKDDPWTMIPVSIPYIVFASNPA